jgi:hypothetical protein
MVQSCKGTLDHISEAQFFLQLLIDMAPTISPCYCKTHSCQGRLLNRYNLNMHKLADRQRSEEEVSHYFAMSKHVFNSTRNSISSLTRSSN